MKRGAEKQLTREREDEDEVEESGEAGAGFRKAEDTVLAGRKIRALPKRFAAPAPPPTAAALTPAPPVPEPAPTSGRFGGFAGFGAPTAGSTPFSFTNTATKPAGEATTSIFGGSSLGAAPAAPLKPKTTSTLGAPSAPAVSTGASSATKTFASFLGSSTPATASSAPAPAKETAPPAPEPASVAMDEDADVVELKYYRSLRGLNVSFISAINKAIDVDPFINVAELLEQYKNLRITVQKEFDAGKTSAPTKDDVKPEVPVKSLAMPAPPATFSGFSGKPQPTNGSTVSGGGFTPKLAPETKSSGFSFPPASSTTSSSPVIDEAPKSAFSFGAPSSTSSTAETSSASTNPAFSLTPSAPAPSAAAALASSAPKSTFTFGASTSSSGEEKSPAPKSAFNFGSGSSTSSPPKSLFGGADASTSLFGNRPSSAFGGGGGSMFGASQTKTGDSFTFGGAGDKGGTTDEKKTEIVPPSGATSLFGSPLGTPLGGTPGGGTPFGGLAPGGSPFGGFSRKGSGSIGNPVGFGFGSPPRTPAADGDGAPLSSTPKPPSAFSFGGPPPTLSLPTGKAAEEKKDDAGGDKEAAPPPEQQQLFGPTEHDVEGPGEEDEDTTHTVRVKVYQMRKGEAKWGDVGVGMLRLKKHKETETRRALLRNSSTGKLIINFKLYSGMNPSIDKNVVSFVGQDSDGQPITYKLRIKAVDQAEGLKAALDRELAAIEA